MRFSEFKIDEGGKSSGVRYNSEVGLLHAFIGTGAFDINNVAGTMDTSKLENPERTLKEIETFLAPVFSPDFFNQWVAVGDLYKQKIAEKSGSLPQKYGWTGGANVGPAADVEFIGHETTGISVKDAGGITLKNLSPKSLGIEGEFGMDVFAYHAQDDYNEMKRKIFTDVLNLAKSTPDKTLIPIKEPYTVTYNSEKNTYTCVGKKTVEMSAEDILSSVGKNAPWQRVFGDWFQANWQSKKEYALPMYVDIARTFEKVIEENLQSSEKLLSMLAFEDKPYYYATPKSLYYIPSASDITDLKVKKIRYGTPDGTSQKYIAEIGYPDSKDNADITIYIRYANGMFETNPTVRIQSLQNPQYISWEKLV